MGFKKVLDTMADVDKTWLDNYSSNYQKQKQKDATERIKKEQGEAVFREGLRAAASEREVEKADSQVARAADLDAEDAQERRRLDFLDSEEGMERYKASTAFIVYHGNPAPGARQEASGDREAGVGSEQPQKRKGIFGFGILNL